MTQFEQHVHCSWSDILTQNLKKKRLQESEPNVSQKIYSRLPHIGPLIYLYASSIIYIYTTIQK